MPSRMRTSAGERQRVRARRQARWLRLALLVGLALVFLSSSAAPAAGPTIESAGGAGGYYWLPASAETAPGGTVDFKSASATIPHGVTWTAGPETPSCPGVPIGEGKTDWAGTCTFAQAGTYRFVCYVHPTEMTGTVVAGSGGPGPGGPDPTDPTAAAVAKALKLPKHQQGGAVKGSIGVVSGAGGRLLVELRAQRRALFDGGKAGQARVGRLLRRSLPSGTVHFSVALSRAAKNALSDRGKLRLTATISVIAQDGDRFVRTRGIVVQIGKASTSTGGAG